jgi:hypothetical protein
MLSKPKVQAPIAPASTPTQASFATEGSSSTARRALPRSRIRPVTGQSSVTSSRPSLLGGA